MSIRTAGNSGEDRRRKRRGSQRLSFLTLLLVGNALAQQAPGPTASPFAPDTPGASHAATDLRVSGTASDGWQYPITKLNQLLPQWLQFGGQFRYRLESQDGLGYAPVNDGYVLTQLRLGVYIQPTSWLKLVGVTQDSRVFSTTTSKRRRPIKTFGIFARHIWSLAARTTAGSIS